MFTNSMRRMLRLVGCCLLLALCVSADTWNKKTYVTFNEAVQIPGQALEPGTYVFKLVDSPADRHIVQILNEREDKVFATLLAIPHIRLKAPDDTLIRFEERASDSPQAVKEWFYPGDTVGQEFIYPKNQEYLLSMNSPWAVRKPVVVAEVMPPVAPATTIEPATPAASDEAVPPTPTADNPEATVPQDPATPAPSAEKAKDDSHESLPKTASDIPLVGLGGLVSLLAAGVISLIRRLC